MLEMLLNPRKAERHPWELFFVGLLYATLSFLLVELIFVHDKVLSKYSGVLLITFTVMFSMPFIYYTIKLEESKIVPTRGTFSLIKEHSRAIKAFLWLFFGFVVAFTFWYIVFSASESFQAQIETFCVINSPNYVQECIRSYGVSDSTVTTSSATSTDRMFLIFANNVYVLIFTLIFSLIFGAGVIFVLAWNASVIAAAAGIFAKSSISNLPISILRYLPHGIFEIGSYFIVALAGGVISVAVIKHEMGTPKFWEILHDSLNLIILAIVILFFAAFVEVYITPAIF